MVVTQAVRIEGNLSVAEENGRPPAADAMDDELLLLLHERDTASLGAELCFRKYETFCMRVASRWSSDDHIAREKGLDVLSHFIERETDPARASFRAGSSIAAYLSVGIRNAFHDHHRRERRHDAATDRDALASVPSPEPAALDAMVAREQRRALLQSLAKLPSDELHVLTLRFAEEPPLTLQQIGDLLGVVPSTVSYRINRALHHLRQLLEMSDVKEADHAAHE